VLSTINKLTGFSVSGQNWKGP